MQKGCNSADGSLAIVRDAYATQVVALGAGTADDRLRAAFGAVRREDFLGPPPWQFGRYPMGFVSGSDPVLAYQDVAFALSPDRGLNSGSPSLHVRMLHRLCPEAGQAVVHLGAGAGYYTAIMSKLVGETGSVFAVEFDRDLAARARANLRGYGNVTVICGDAMEWPREFVDRIYVNFMVSRPADAWIERLKAGGRLLVPIGFPIVSREEFPQGVVSVRSGRGGAFLIERKVDGFGARWVAPARFIWAEGSVVANDANDTALRLAIEGGGIAGVRSLVWSDAPPTRRLWFRGDRWALSYDDPDSTAR